MKKNIIIITLAVLFLFQLCSLAQTKDTATIFPKGKVVAANFTGNVWVQPLVPQDSIFNLVAGAVTFSPGARSYWHTHNAGQILLIIDGTGYTQEKGKPIRVIHKGEVVICPPNVEHWHGASPGSSMTQISLNTYADKGVVNWLRPVTDEEYSSPTLPNKSVTMKTILSVITFFMLTGLTTNIQAQSKMNSNQKLDSKQQRIVSISALTATGNMEYLKVELNKGLDAGLTVNEIKEVLVQLYAYCGFPRSLNGIIAFMAVIEDRKAKGINDTEGEGGTIVTDNNKYQTGKKNLQTLTNKEEKSLSGANAFAPAIDTFLKEHLFADIFSRDVLSFQQRELVTVSALAAMTGVASQLQAHIGMGMNTGLTEPQFKEAFEIIDQSVSKKQGDIARETLGKVLVAKKQ
jgi:4-carboxymuconolactone decarboxylase